MRECTEGVLDAVAELGEDGIGNVGGVLRHEIDAYALASDESDDLFNLVNKALWGVGEERMGFVEEEYESRQLLVADFGQACKEVGKEP